VRSCTFEKIRKVVHLESEHHISADRDKTMETPLWQKAQPISLVAAALTIEPRIKNSKTVRRKVRASRYDFRQLVSIQGRKPSELKLRPSSGAEN
jgi:hypothetical protein